MKSIDSTTLYIAEFNLINIILIFCLFRIIHVREAGHSQGQ